MPLGATIAWKVSVHASVLSVFKMEITKAITMSSTRPSTAVVTVAVTNHGIKRDFVSPTEKQVN